MQIKLLKDVVVSIAGTSSEKIVDYLYNKKNVNEFLIAKKLGVNVNQARNILYKLSDHGLVSFVRKKDKNNGGWYTYFWTLDVGKSLFNLKNTLEHEIKSLDERINSRKTKRFYYSPAADVEYSEEKALEYEFICPETGEVMELKDNVSEIIDLEKKVEILKKDLEIVNEEIGKILKKDESARKRRITAEEAKKAAERLEKRKKRAEEKAKEIKGKAKETKKKVKDKESPLKNKKSLPKIINKISSKKSLDSKKLLKKTPLKKSSPTSRKKSINPKENKILQKRKK